MATTVSGPGNGKAAAPPPPPKPLHLTMSMRGTSDTRKGSGYPSMPSWSRASQPQPPLAAEDDDDDDDADVEDATMKLKGADGGSVASGMEEWLTAKSRLPTPTPLEDLFKDAGTSTLDEPRARSRQARQSGSGASTIRRTRRTSTLKGKPIRTSIFFDPLLQNPLVDPSEPAPPVPATEDPDGKELPEEGDFEHVLDLAVAMPAISLHAFSGEAAFGELSFDGGRALFIEDEDLGGGWSLGYVEDEGEECRGLIPQGWYRFIDLTAPNQVEPLFETSVTLLDIRPNSERTESTIIAEPESPSRFSMRTPPPPIAASEPEAGPLSPNSAPLPPSAPSTPPVDPPRASPNSLGPSRPLPSPPIVLTPSPTLSDSPSMIRSRSIGRNVVISGIVFEPTDSVPPTPNLPALAHFAHTPAWLDEDAPPRSGVMTPVLNSDEALEFFTAVRSPIQDSFELPDGEQSSWAGLESPHEDERSTVFWQPDSSRSTLFVVPESDEAEPPTSDSMEAREARWSALVAQADREPPAPSPEADEDDTLSFPFAMYVAEPVVQPPPSPVHARPSTFFDRFGLGTFGRAGPSGTLSRSQSFSAAGRSKSKNVVQDWILQGDPAGAVETSDAAQTFSIESGPVWTTDAPAFTVHVHSPEKRSSMGKADYTVFQLTTVFPPSDTSPSASSDIDESTVSVERRYSHFALLYAVLVERFPLLVIPALPAKTYAGRFQVNFVETRRRDLERWCFRVGRHPVLRCSDEVRGFLVMENETELRNLLMPPKSAGPSGPSDSGTAFLNRVFHPEFNVNQVDAQETVERFERHARASELGGGVRDVDASIGKVRDGLRDTATTLFGLAHNLTRLVSGLALPPISASGVDADLSDADSVSDKDRLRALALGLQNDDGALTWKDSCEESLSTSKAIQAAAEAIGAIAELYDLNARSTMLPVHELARESTYPYSQHLTLIQTHRQALAQHDHLTRSRPAQSDPETHSHEEAISRCETVLNITSAEIERAHTERGEDLRTLAEQLLDGEIAFHEAALEKLRFARSHFDPSCFAALAHTGPRLRSHLERGPPSLPPLPVPSTYGVPTSAFAIGSPVGVVTEAVGSVFRGGAAAPVVYSARASATAGTVGKSAAQILKQSESWREESQAPPASWRESIFGTVKLW